MSDRMWGKIWIGEVPQHLVHELRKQLDNAGLIGKNEGMGVHIDDRGLLALEDNEARYGRFENLEEWLETNKVEYDRQSDGCYEYSPERVSYRRNVGLRCSLLDYDGRVIIRVDDVLNLINQNPDMGSLILRLQEELGQDLSPLKPFDATMVAKPPSLAADELKRRNTDPAAKTCAQCGGALSDPGMGPSFKHCHKCEP